MKAKWRIFRIRIHPLFASKGFSREWVPVGAAMASVLIVEDHQAVREGLVEAFTAWGYSVASAGTMEEAHFHLNRTNFDLVVTDVDLGGENGLELVRFGGTSCPQTAFIVISGRFSPKEIFGQGFEVGDKLRYLQKPFLLSQLQAVVALLQEDGQQQQVRPS